MSRRVRRHSVLALSSLSATGALYGILPSEDPVWLLSMATAYPALALLALSLLTGPWNVLRNRPNPVSTGLRRDIGIWAAVIGTVHVAVGLFVHVRGRPWIYFLWEDWDARTVPFRYDIAGLANWTGLAATLLLVGLLALSNDWSLRCLGTVRWKALQRWNYAVAALVVVHGATYQLIERRTAPLIAAFALVTLVLVSVQIAGASRVRARRRARPAVDEPAPP